MPGNLLSNIAAAGINSAVAAEGPQQNPNNPAANAYDKYNYLDPSQMNTQVSAGRQGVADGSWVPFQNYSSMQGSNSGLYTPKSPQAAISPGVGFQSNPLPPPPSGPGYMNNPGLIDQTHGVDPNSIAPGTLPIAPGAAPQAAPGPGLVSGPGPGGFYGSALSRYLTGK